MVMGGESSHDGHHRTTTFTFTFCKLGRAAQSVRKTKTLFQNTLQGLKSLLNGGVPDMKPAIKSLLKGGVPADLKPAIKSLNLNPLSSCTKLDPRRRRRRRNDHHHHGDYHQIFFSREPGCDQLKQHHDAKGYYYPTHDLRKSTLNHHQVDENHGTTAPNNNLTKPSSASPDGAFFEIKEPSTTPKKNPSLPKARSCHEGRKRQQQPQAPPPEAAPRSCGRGCRVAGNHNNNLRLAQKMRDLEMLDMGDDVDHTLDVVEALHCYSCLTSPVYLDLVDNFFMDMYADFSSAPDHERREVAVTNFVTNPSSSSRRLDLNPGLAAAPATVNSDSQRFGGGSSSRKVHDSSSQRFMSESRRLGPIKVP